MIATIEHMPAWLIERRNRWAQDATDCYDAAAQTAGATIREAFDECGETYDAYAYAITMEFNYGD